MRCRRRAGAAAWVVVGVASALLGRACEGGCCCDPTTYVDTRSDETEGPVRAHIEIARGWRVTESSKIPGMSQTRVPSLVVEGRPPVRLLLSRCPSDAPEVRADARGERIAYRCQVGRWAIVYRRAGSAFEHCSVDAPAGNEIDWAHVPAWDATALDLLTCLGTVYTTRGARSPARPGAAQMLAAERTAGGEEALARLLARARDLPMRLWSSGNDPWLDAARGLSPAARAPLLEALSGALGEPAVPVPRAWRAIVLRGLDAPDASLRRLAERLVGEVAISPVEDDVARRSPLGGDGSGFTTPRQAYAQATLSVLLRRLATSWGARAGQLACTAVERTKSQRRLSDELAAPDVARHLALVVGVTRTRCPSVTEELGCGPSLECDPRTGAAPVAGAPDIDSLPCRPDQLAAELATAIVTDPIRAVWSDGAPPARGAPSIWAASAERDRFAYAAAVLGGFVPPPLALKLARRHYRLEPAAGPECSALPASVEGRPCRCGRVGLRDLACTSSESRTTFSSVPFCTLELDDADGVARQRRAGCLEYGHCGRDDQCCAGTICASYVDGGPRSCRRPSDAGPPDAESGEARR